MGKDETVALLRQNSRAAAAAVRAFTDEQLDRAAAVSLNSDAPLTTQFFIEDHALRHSWHHLAKIKRAVLGEKDLTVLAKVLRRIKRSVNSRQAYTFFMRDWIALNDLQRCTMRSRRCGSRGRSNRSK